MFTRWVLSPLLLAAAVAVSAQSRVDLTAVGKHLAGARTQVLVLGTVHLREAPKSFTPTSLAPLIDRLAAYRPQIITIEHLSGESCDHTARFPKLYAPEDFAPFCGDTARAKAATGLDVPAAVAESKSLLKDWPAQPAPAQRRQLAAVFLAAGDFTSALVQWLQLPAADRHAGDGLDDALAKELERSLTRNDETIQVAARLAARLGLQRVYPVDDHTGDNVDVADGAAYGKAIQQAWDRMSAAETPNRNTRKALWEKGDMLGVYRFINRPDVLQTAIESDFGAALRDTSPQHYGQMYVAGWETRNLRMVANVRATFRETPGARVLSIVGATHKPWFDSLLGQMQGVEIVDVEQVLK